MSALHDANYTDLGETLRCVRLLFTKIRDLNTPRVEFARVATRLMTILCEEGMAHVGGVNKPTTVNTPPGCSYAGFSVDPDSLVAVSIIRAGDSMLDAFLSVYPEAAVGKILIQRDEDTKQPVLYYSKLPPLESKHIILLDPMLATGGSAKAAVKVLIDRGVPEENITFFNVVCCPEGLRSMYATYPKIKIITGAVDDGLDVNAYIVPGLGDYGDRFYGTK